MNALRGIETASEIEVRLQSNEVLVHLPSDTPIGAVSQGIFDAGYKAEGMVWLTAQGSWTAHGFLPADWSQAIPAEKPAMAADGVWELVFKREGDDWIYESASPVKSVPQIKDVDES